MIMKQNILVKTISCFLFLLAILFLSPDSSIAQLKISVLAGVNNSKIPIETYNISYLTSNFSDISDSSHMESGYSFFGGLKIEKELTNSLSIGSGLLLNNVEYVQNIHQKHYINSSTQYLTIGQNITKLLYLSVPLRLVFYAPLEKTRIYIGVGGYISYGLLGTYEFKTSSNNDPGIIDSIGAITFSSNDKIKYATYHANRIDYGLSVIAGIELRNNFFFELGVNSGLRSVFNGRYVVLHGSAVVYNYYNTITQSLFGIGYHIK